MRVGSLDAAVVYQVNVQAQAEHFDFVPIPADKAHAVQPFSVRSDSEHKYLSNRLLAFLKAHRESFEKAGFAWRGDDAPVKSDKIELPPWLKSAPQ
jgi:hypothetical protein